MSAGEITVTLTRTEAEELHCLLEWTNDPQFRDLSWRVVESINAAEDAKREASAKSLTRSGADSLPSTDQTTDEIS
jgi:hypothetical protein